jgi:phosphate transport system permease protein
MRGSKRRHRKERTVRTLFQAAAVLGLVISIAIVLALIEEAIRWLFDIQLGWLWTEGWVPRSNQFDLLTIFAGTVMVAVIAMLVAAPLGLGAAAYLSEYATPRTRRTLKPILETLASIPSVVLGYFALQWINPELVRRIFGSAGTFNLLAAGLAVGILTIPLVASVAEDALHAVPHALREGAYGIGARRKTVTTRVVFPAAVSGIVASLILGFSRAVGETMIVAIAAGATGGALRTFNPLERGQTMTGAISSLAIGSDQVRGSGFAFDSLYFVGLLLFAITFLLNVVSEGFVRRVRSRY